MFPSINLTCNQVPIRLHVLYREKSFGLAPELFSLSESCLESATSTTKPCVGRWFGRQDRAQEFITVNEKRRLRICLHILIEHRREERSDARSQLVRLPGPSFLCRSGEGQSPLSCPRSIIHINIHKDFIC